MMNLGIVQNHDNVPRRVFFQDISQKGHKHLGIIGFMILNINLTCFIVQNPKQFDTLMFAIGLNNLLPPFDKPCFLDCLVIADHGLILIQ